MGYSGLESNEIDSVESISYTKYFEMVCPIYMSFGMSYQEFWYDSPYIAKFYREANEIKVRRKDEEFWEQGMYIYDAIYQNAPILHPFSKAKKPLPYTEKPYLYKKDLKTQEDIPTEQEIENERIKARLQLMQWGRTVAKQFKKQ